MHPSTCNISAQIRSVTPAPRIFHCIEQSGNGLPVLFCRSSVQGRPGRSSSIRGTGSSGATRYIESNHSLRLLSLCSSTSVFRLLRLPDTFVPLLLDSQAFASRVVESLRAVQFQQTPDKHLVHDFFRFSNPYHTFVLRASPNTPNKLRLGNNWTCAFAVFDANSFEPVTGHSTLDYRSSWIWRIHLS